MTDKRIFSAYPRVRAGALCLSVVSLSPEDGEDVNLQIGNFSTLFIQNKGFYQKKKTIFAFRDPFALIAALYSVGM